MNTKNPNEVRYDPLLSNADDEAVAQVTARVLLSSAMLVGDQTNIMQSENHAVEVSFDTHARTDPQGLLDNDGAADRSATARVVPGLQVNDEVFVLNKEPKGGVVASTFPGFGNLKKAAQGVADLLEVANIKHVVHAVSELTEATNSSLKHAATFVADFIPVVGNSRMMFQSSRVRKTMDEVNADELENNPLHKASALSASMFLDSSSRSSVGGDLSSIKRLVEEDPTRLHTQLPTSGDTPLSIAIKFGAMQWIQLQDYPSGTSNLPIVEYLIQADIEYLRSQAVREKKSSGEKSPISLASLIAKSSLYKRDCEEELPLHNAIGDGYGGAARALLNVDKDIDYASISVKNAHGDLPLHMAVRGDDLALVKLLLDADKFRQDIQLRHGTGDRPLPESRIVPSLTTPNPAGDIPLHVSLSSFHRFKMWGLLLDADKKKETLHIRNLKGATAFRFFVDRPNMCEHEESFVDAHLAEPILDRLLSGKRLEPWDNHLKRSVAKSLRMQAAMNEASANRVPVMIFMADLWSHSASAAMLYLGTKQFIEGGAGIPWVSQALYALVGYFLMRTLIRLFLTRSFYWASFWNYIDIVRICLLLVLALGVSGRKFKTDVWDDYVVRQLMLALGVFIYMGLVGFFRVTYKPFALFVGGIAQIIVTLIPFMVTFTVVLALFAYGYWVGGFISAYAVDGEPSSYTWWLYEVFLSAFNGTEDLSKMQNAYINHEVWNALFMLLVQMLLLNLLIAVITSSWENATEKSMVVFWQYRLEYASGVLPIEYFLRRYFEGSCLYTGIAKCGELVDGLDDKGLKDHVNWDVYPYYLVMQDQSLYWDSRSFALKIDDMKKEQMRQGQPSESSINPGQSELDFNEEMLQLQEVKSLRHWQHMQSYGADFRFSSSSYSRLCTWLRIVRFFALYCLAFVAGLVTFGYCWPRRVRTLVCGAGLSLGDAAGRGDGQKERSETGHLPERPSYGLVPRDRYDALEKKVDEMKEPIEALHRTVEQLVKLQSKPPSPQGARDD
jgi:ankyrin repeat protein